MKRVWLNGEMVDAGHVCVDGMSSGVLTGTGVFESMKVRDGEAFAQGRHLARLHRSAATFGISVPEDAVLRRALNEVISDFPEATRVRITLFAPRIGGDNAIVLVHGETNSPWPDVAHVVTSSWVRNEQSPLAGTKSTSYAENVIARDDARRRGADEALLFDSKGFLSEGTASNVFLEVNGKLCTPGPENGCLAGVTAELVCEVAEVHVRPDVTAAMLAASSEVFLTSSTRDVHPVASLDGRKLPFAPGRLTHEAMHAFAALQDRTNDP